MDSTYYHWDSTVYFFTFQFHVYPESAHQLVMDNARQHYLFTVDSEKGLLKGYSMAAHSGQVNNSLTIHILNVFKETIRGIHYNVK